MQMTISTPQHSPSRPRKRVVLMVFMGLAVLVAGVWLARRVYDSLDVSTYPSLETLLHRPLPVDSQLIASAGSMNPFNGERCFTLKLSEDSFHAYTRAIGFVHRDDLFSNFPSCFTAPKELSWPAISTNDEDTLFLQDSVGGFAYARWQGGYLYVKYSIN